MTTSYRPEVASAFEVLADGLAPFVDARMSTAFPGDDWVLVAAGKLGKRRDVLVSLSDPHFQLEVINRWWGPVFAAALGEARRPTITELRTARNHWAHPDPDHPLDLDYALRVHLAAEDVLRAIDAPEADLMADLAAELRWKAVRDQAREQGETEADLLLHELAALQKQRDELYAQLEQARDVARSATGRQRAVARQLAELQSQYAAVSGLRDDYAAVRRQLEDERARGEDGDMAPEVRHRLAEATVAVDGLQEEAELLRSELDRTRLQLRDVDPMLTDAGRRWVWLMIGLVITMAITIVLVAFTVPNG